jgi:hypothetical protein
MHDENNMTVPGSDGKPLVASCMTRNNMTVPDSDGKPPIAGLASCVQE